jgi:hypothetical protein
MEHARASPSLSVLSGAEEEYAQLLSRESAVQTGDWVVEARALCLNQDSGANSCAVISLSRTYT